MAAQRLGISDRQCRRLLLRYHESGPPGMANRRREKPSDNQLPDGLAQYALSIIRERYTDFGPTLACENLAELHDVTCPKRLSVHSWSKPVAGSLANNVRRKFSSHVIAGLAAAN